MSSKNRERKNQVNLEYYYRNKDRILAQAREKSKEFYEKNRDTLLARAKKSRELNYEKQVWRSTKNRALSLGIPFDITVEDIVIPETCPYLGIPLTRFQGRGTVWSNASIDRIDPDGGYVKGNIEMISRKANMMKTNATIEELLTFSKNVLKRHEQIVGYLK